MSVVNEDVQASSEMLDAYGDLEHQVIRQRATLEGGTPSAKINVEPGTPAFDFDPADGLDREEYAMLVRYDRAATMFVAPRSGTQSSEPGASQLDAGVGSNGRTFATIKNDEQFNPDDDAASLNLNDFTDSAVIDQYNLAITTPFKDATAGAGGGGTTTKRAERTYKFYDWPTAGPVFNFQDTLNVGIEQFDKNNCEHFITAEIRYDFWWYVIETEADPGPFQGLI